MEVAGARATIHALVGSATSTIGRTGPVAGDTAGVTDTVACQAVAGFGVEKTRDTLTGATDRALIDPAARAIRRTSSVTSNTAAVARTARNINTIIRVVVSAIAHTCPLLDVLVARAVRTVRRERTVTETAARMT